MKISQILAAAKIDLQKSSIPNPSLDALILLCHVLGLTKEKIIFNPDTNLTTKEEEEFLDLIKRRQKREPISHLTKKREFYGVNFNVTKDVLDPRPDSEHLIELILEKYTNQNQKLELLEVGVGSGCLIISLLILYKNCTALALDISPEALKIAQKNAQKNNVTNRLNFLESDLFTSLNNSQKFDIIISNPPYIPSADILKLEPEVKNFEPLLALDGGPDGLKFYRQIAKNAKNHLKDKGKIFLEIGIGQTNDIEKIFEEQNFKLTTIKKDLSKIDRILEFELK